jgi:hypothetical protein
MTFKLFVSYSRNDNMAPPDVSDGVGFVTLLVDRLKRRFTELGPPGLEIFFDTDEIKKHERFPERISSGLAEADVLLVAMSPNWLASDYCRQELATFVRQRSGLDRVALAKRTFIVGRRHVDLDKRPPELQDVEGYHFYDLEKGKPAGSEREFYDRGRVDPRFTDRLYELVRDLWQMAQTEPLPVPSGKRAARTLFLAKPAADFRYAYNRLYDELESRGFAVVPTRELESSRIAEDATLVADALREAEIAVHLLGQSQGPPNAQGESLVGLQLRLANEEGARRGGAFARLIWAPRFVVDEDGVKLSDDQREPVEIVRRVERLAEDQRLGENDTVDGSELAAFRDIVLRYLELHAPTQAVTYSAMPGKKFFLLHVEEDTDFAIEVGRALEGRQLTVVPPETDGPAAEVDAANANLLASCDAVVACWANAFETRVMAQLRKLMDATQIGGKTFELKGLVVGPEPKPAKKRNLALPPRPIVDRTLDLTRTPVTPAALDPLFMPEPS